MATQTARAERKPLEQATARAGRRTLERTVARARSQSLPTQSSHVATGLEQCQRTLTPPNPMATEPAIVEHTPVASPLRCPSPGFRDGRCYCLAILCTVPRMAPHFERLRPLSVPPTMLSRPVARITALSRRPPTTRGVVTDATRARGTQCFVSPTSTAMQRGSRTHVLDYDSAIP